MCCLTYTRNLVDVTRALPWDPNIGEEAGELDSFIRFLVMRLLNSLKGKAFNYTRDPGDDAQVCHLRILVLNVPQISPSWNFSIGKKQSVHDQQHVLSASPTWTIG